MTETAEQQQPEAPQVNLETPDISPAAKPEFPADMAGWLVTKLDCEVELKSHADRNNFAACINQLIAIANWKAPE